MWTDAHTSHGPKPSSLGLDQGSEFTSPTRARWATTDICPTSKLQELMRELGDIDIGVGTLQATNARMAMVVEDSALAVTGVRKAAILLYM